MNEQLPFKGKKKKSSAKRKKGANCRAVKAKANAAPPLTKIPPKRKKDIYSPYKALFPFSLTITPQSVYNALKHP